MSYSTTCPHRQGPQGPWFRTANGDAFLGDFLGDLLGKIERRSTGAGVSCKASDALDRHKILRFVLSFGLFTYEKGHEKSEVGDLTLLPEAIISLWMTPSFGCVSGQEEP